jgi:hypothetical protein
MESLEKHVRELSGIIEQEFERYTNIFELVKLQQTVLVNADMAGLEANIHEQHSIVRAINKLENKRIQKLEVIGIYLGIVPEQLKLASIIEVASDDMSATLSRVERRFKSLIQEIFNITKSNKYLVDRSLLFLEKNIQVFYGAMEEKGVYSYPNSKTQSTLKNNSLLDRKA